MDAPDRYKMQHVRWMEDRAEGALDDDGEAKWAEKLDTIWRELTPEQKEEVEQWTGAQLEYRKANGMPGPGEAEGDLTPGEREAVEYQGEYELILAENEHDVVFQVRGRDVTISRGVVLDYDESGRFWLTRLDAEKLGLLPESPPVVH
jgi:hypothetical protein